MPRSSTRRNAVRVALAALAVFVAKNVYDHSGYHRGNARWGWAPGVWVNYGRVCLWIGGDVTGNGVYKFELSYMPFYTWSWWAPGHLRPVDEMLVAPPTPGESTQMVPWPLYYLKGDEAPPPPQ